MNKYLLVALLWSVSLLCHAGFNDGVMAYEKGDFQTAFTIWKTIAEQKPAVTGDFEWHSSQSKNTVEAQYALALLYWQGKGVAQNYAAAQKWLTLAADSGHSEAQLKLAYLYLEGLNGKANVSEACKRFEQAAQQGNRTAQYNLGLLYWRGLSVVQDTTLAKKWLTAAASQGDASAKELLAEIKATPSPSAMQAAHENDTPASIDIPAPEPESVSSQPQPVVNTPLTRTEEPAPIAVFSGTEPTFTKSSTPPDDYYAVQLVGSPKQKDVLQFMASWQASLNPLVMTDKMKKSEHIFVVVYGRYASATEAKQAITHLPPELKKSRPWVVKMHGDTLASKS